MSLNKCLKDCNLFLEEAQTSLNGLVRPDIVMFGENLPEQFYQHEKDFKDCDCLIN